MTAIQKARKLKKDALALLNNYPPDYIEKAQAAIDKGKAFCPVCHSAGMANCGYFDECNEFVMPNGSRAK